MGLFSGDNSDWRIGIAFSGGGARCMAHLGVLKALEDADIRPQVMAGTSMGAIIGALYAKGVSIETMLNEIEKINFVGMLRRLRLRSKTGLMSLDHFRNLLEMTKDKIICHQK
jgi:NTE family protein